MSTLYSDPDFPKKGPELINQELMKSVSSNPLRLLLPQHITTYIQALWSKKANGQPVTFADIFGMLIGETLIPSVCNLLQRVAVESHCNIERLFVLNIYTQAIDECRCMSLFM